MDEVRLSEIVSILSRIRGTSSKNEKIALAAEFLKNIPADQLGDNARLMIGQLLPSEFGSPGVQFSDFGDPRAIGSQTTLYSEKLTVSRVVNAFREIYSTSGTGSRQRKASILRGLLNDASKDEIEFLIGCITGDIRAGFSEGLLIESIAKASNRDSNEIKELIGIATDIGRVAEQVLGGNGIQNIVKIEPMKPIRVMLADTAETVGQAMAITGSPAAFEYKLDGIRVQIHIANNMIKIFSRRQTEIKNSLPEIIDSAKSIKASSAILDGEVIAFKDKPLPFQDVMRRVTRERDISGEAQETPVRLYLFDLLFLDGVSLIDSTYDERSKKLSEIAPDKIKVPRLISSSETEATLFFIESISAGHEGLLVKNLMGKYQLGKRTKDWIKVKEHVTIDAAIIAAEWGHGRRSNWLSNYHLGVRKADGFAMIGKTFKGVTDADLKHLTDRLLSSVEEDHGSWVKVKPKIVLEIAFNEIQHSPKYESGMALRFARVLRIRDDKIPEDATTEKEVKEIMERQFNLKAKRLK